MLMTIIINTLAIIGAFDLLMFLMPRRIQMYVWNKLALIFWRNY